MNFSSVLILLLWICSLTTASVIRIYDDLPELYFTNETAEEQPIWNQTLLDEGSANTNRSGRTSWYHRQSINAPDVEAGSSSSESLDSWSMECDCKTTTRKSKTTTKASTTTSSTVSSSSSTEPSTTRTTAKLNETTPKTEAISTSTTTRAAVAFDDPEHNGDEDSAEISESFHIGDLTWRKRYRIWLRRCGCDEDN